MSINIKINNLDKVQANMARVGSELPAYLGGARIEITDAILDTPGLRRYPPATGANAPPVPYYIRGRGTQLATRNLGNSERLGTRWLSVPYGKIGMKISNPVSYAPRVHGDEQPPFMAAIGWRKLKETAYGMVGKIAAIYNKWIDALIRKHNL